MEVGKLFVDTLGKRVHVTFLGYEHWYMSISTSKLKYHYISVLQDKYSTSVVAKHLDTATIKENSKFHMTTFPHDIIFTK